MDLASTIPDKKVNVSRCTFSTYPVKFDHKLTPDLQKIASGGTDFSAIVEYQKDNNLLDAPVIVITDGYACFYGNDHPSNMNSNWHWLVFDGRGIGDRRVTKNIENYTDFVAWQLNKRCAKIDTQGPLE